MCHTTTPTGKFLLGQIVATPNALNAIPPDEIKSALDRHSHGEWGTVGQDDWNANEQALLHGGRLFSAYQSAQKIKFWIITEHDRSITTVLLPEDY